MILFSCFVVDKSFALVRGAVCFPLRPPQVVAVDKSGYIYTGISVIDAVDHYRSPVEMEADRGWGGEGAPTSPPPFRL